MRKSHFCYFLHSAAIKVPPLDFTLFHFLAQHSSRILVLLKLDW